MSRFAKAFILSLAGLFAAAAVLYCLLCLTGVISQDRLRFTAGTDAGEYPLAAAPGDSLTFTDSTVIAAGSGGASLFSSHGEFLAASDGLLRKPVIRTRGDWALVYDDERLCVFDGEGLTCELRPGETILSARVSREGAFAVCSAMERYSGAVTVYSPEGKALWQLKCAGEPPVTAAVSPDGKSAAVLRLAGGQTRLEIYSLQDTAPRYSETTEFFTAGLDYTDTDRLLLAGGDGLLLLDGDGGRIGRADLTAVTQESRIAGDGIAAVVTVGIGGKREMTVFDRDFAVTGAVPLENENSQIALCGHYIAVKDGENITVYDRQLVPCGSFDAPGEGRLWLRGDGAVCTVQPESITVLRAQGGNE